MTNKPTSAATTAAPADARQVALDLLDAVLVKQVPLDQALAADRHIAALSARDRAFARLLTATVLRRLGQLDDVLNRFLQKPLRAGRVRDALRLGAAQLLFLDTPPHAAVGTSVDLVQRAGFAAMKGVVNAVLRRVVAEGKAIIEKQNAPRLNTPAWLLQSWTQSYGDVTARAIAKAHLVEAPLDLSVKGDEAGWATKLGATLLPTGSLRRAAGGAIEALPGYDEGAWWVQDAAAALPVKLLGDVKDRTVADLCAAPGGKTAQLAASGGKVIALDSSAQRLERLKSNLARLKLNAECIVANAESWRPSAKLPFILLDAPCTATGAIRRNPDVPHLKKPEDVARLAAQQDRMLAHAATILATDGILVYCTCSLEAAEGPERIAKFLAANPGFVRRPITAAEVGGLEDCVSNLGDLRTLPSMLAAQGGLDGFYAARLVRKP